MNLKSLIDRFRGPLIGMIASWGASPNDAIELAQETFSEAYLSRERFRGDWENPQASAAWLRGIASNLHAARVRKQRLQHALQERALEEAPEANDLQQSEPLDADAERLRAAMDKLKGAWKTVLLMRYVEDSSLTEIGALLGLSARAVEGRLHRARAALRQELAGEAAEQSPTPARGPIPTSKEEEKS